MTQMIHKPTRITKSSQTLDLISANKPDRIIKTYSLITGLSDHNLILAARKLTKAELWKSKFSEGKIEHAFYLPKGHARH